MRAALLTGGMLLAAATCSAEVVTLLPSNESLTLTALGPNNFGLATYQVTFGACTFAGQTNTCRLSGRYTGLGGGAYSIVLSYLGNGPSPLTATAQTPGSDLLIYSISSGSLVSTLTPDSGSPVNFYYTFTNFFFSPSTDQCTGVSTCSVGSVGASTGATISGPVNGQLDPTPTVRADTGIVTVTQYGGFPQIAPGTWVEIYGFNLATTLRRQWGGADFNGSQAPTSLAGTTVTVGGKQAFIEYADASQLDLQVPSDVPTGPQPVVITTAGGASRAVTVTVNAVEPGLLAPPVFRVGTVQYAVAQFPDAKTYVLPPGAIPGALAARAKPGDTITLYGVGFGPVSPAINAGVIVEQANSLSGVQVSVGGQPATVSYAGLVSHFLGLYQFNIVIPRIAASDAAPLTFTINGVAGSQTLYLAIGS